MYKIWDDEILKMYPQLGIKITNDGACYMHDIAEGMYVLDFFFDVCKFCLFVHISFFLSLIFRRECVVFRYKKIASKHHKTLYLHTLKKKTKQNSNSFMVHRYVCDT